MFARKSSCSRTRKSITHCGAFPHTGQKKRDQHSEKGPVLSSCNRQGEGATLKWHATKQGSLSCPLPGWYASWQERGRNADSPIEGTAGRTHSRV
eukprot:scaffold25128_cov19-Tisochrysis_lutea.AAC.1